MEALQFDPATLINVSVGVLIGTLVGALIGTLSARRMLRRSVADVARLTAEAGVHAANAERYFETSVRFLEHFAKEVLTELDVLEDIGFEWIRDKQGRLLNARINLKLRSRRAASAGDAASPRIAS